MVEPQEGGDGNRRPIVIGKVSGIYGVSGWLRVLSYTRPRENILGYQHWLLGQGGRWKSRDLAGSKIKGKAIIAKLEGLDDRDEARTLIGQDIAVYRDQLEELPEGEFYWYDLMALDVYNLQGIQLGKVTDIYETGANDVIVVTGEMRHLIPLILDRYVKKVDRNKQRMIVDWDPGYS